MTASAVRTAARILLVLLIAVISLLALLPQQDMPMTSGWDKLDHVFAFAVLGLLAQRGFTDRPPPVSSRLLWRRPYGFSVRQSFPPLLLLGYGVGLELAQVLVPGRVPSMVDVLADTLGLVLAALLYAIWQRSMTGPSGTESISEQAE